MIRRLLSRLLTRLRDSLIADDPDPEHSALDRLNGLTDLPRTPGDARNGEGSGPGDARSAAPPP